MIPVIPVLNHASQKSWKSGYFDKSEHCSQKYLLLIKEYLSSGGLIGHSTYFNFHFISFIFQFHRSRGAKKAIGYGTSLYIK
jgi:hypothetical protein